MAEFKDRLLEAIKSSNLKQADIVERTGINKGSLSSYLSGKYKPKQDNTYRLAKILDVNEAWLMGFDVDKERCSTIYIDQEDNYVLSEVRLFKSYTGITPVPYNHLLAAIAPTNTPPANPQKAFCLCFNSLLDFSCFI